MDDVAKYMEHLAGRPPLGGSMARRVARAKMDRLNRCQQEVIRSALAAYAANPDVDVDDRIEAAALAELLSDVIL